MSDGDGFDWEAHAANRGLLGQQDFVKVNLAASRLQWWWRRVRWRRVIQRRAEAARVIFIQARIRTSILGIQTNFRMMRTRTQYKMQMAKIIKFQSLLKGFFVRRICLQVLKEKRAAPAIQRWWRMVRQRRRYRAKVAKVIFIQACIRRLIQRRRFLRGRTAILGLQTNFRMMRTRTQYKIQMAKIIKCQSLIKGFFMRRLYLQVLKDRRGAALAIQGWWRRVKKRREMAQENARIKAEEEQMEQEEASVGEKKDGDEMRREQEGQVEVRMGMGSPQSERREVEGMRTRDARGRELLTSPPSHNMEPDT